MPAMKLKALQADITTLAVDAIVNAANSSLLGGGGVDGAIHRAAGPQLLEACRLLEGCEVGKAKMTPGFHLLAAHVIHTVGPIWQNGEHGEPIHLAACYRNSLLLANQHHCASIAFPAISTGVYRYPPELAAQVAVSTIREILPQCPKIREVIFCCFTEQDLAL